MLDITKASGEKEKFDQEKLYQSLKVAGAKEPLAQKVLTEVKKNVYPGITSREIFRGTVRSLRKASRPIAARYQLKNAIMELGPSGFLFENYVARIFTEYGYNVKRGQIVKGHCVNHEIDVAVEKDGKRFMIECKYHNQRGLKSDVKVALYTYARFLDTKQTQFFNQPWLVTNTKCTTQAIQYGQCAGLKIIGWHYPRGGSLEYLIEEKQLYPVTILFYLPRYLRERLAQKNLLLVKDLLKYSVDDLVRVIGVPKNIAQKLYSGARELCAPGNCD